MPNMSWKHADVTQLLNMQSVQMQLGPKPLGGSTVPSPTTATKPQRLHNTKCSHIIDSLLFTYDFLIHSHNPWILGFSAFKGWIIQNNLFNLLHLKREKHRFVWWRAGRGGDSLCLCVMGPMTNRLHQWSGRTYSTSMPESLLRLEKIQWDKLSQTSCLLSVFSHRQKEGKKS